MNRVIAILMITGAVFSQPVAGKGVDYTNRNYTIESCELFAKDAYHAASTYKRGVVLHKVLTLIEQVPMASSKRQRMFQAIQFVWKYQLDNPVLARSIAMGLCLKPKQQMAPMDEPWLTSPRTSREFY